MSKTFSLGAVLSVTGEKLVAPIGDVYEILNYMTGDNLFTHQLPLAARACKPVLLEQYPQLATVDETGCSPETWQQWLAEREREFGAELDVSPLDNWQPSNPVDDLRMLTDGEIIAVEHPDSPPVKR